jgi:hypothetical protein
MSSAADAIAAAGFQPDPTVNLIDTVPDVTTGGNVVLTSLETSALTDLTTIGAQATAQAVNGALPFNPSNPLFGGLPRGSTTAVPQQNNGFGLLIILFLVLLFL